jgi:hypothetical protein
MGYVSNDLNQIEVAVYDRVREYLRVDKHLGGLIKTFVSIRADKLGREVKIYIPELEPTDSIEINGMLIDLTKKATK